MIFEIILAISLKYQFNPAWLHYTNPVMDACVEALVKNIPAPEIDGEDITLDAVENADTDASEAQTEDAAATDEKSTENGDSEDTSSADATDTDTKEADVSSDDEIAAAKQAEEEAKEASEKGFEEEPMDATILYPTTTVNVRSLPTTESDILGTVDIYDEVTCVATVRSYNGKSCFFYKTEAGNYVSGDYMSLEKTAPIAATYTPVVKEGIEYYTCGNTITLPSGGYDVSTINIGLKVIWINQRLLGTTTAKYTADTEAAVNNFQNSAGLPVTGVVDLNTWLALGYSEDDWYNLGTYITPLKVSAGASHEECVNAMIQTAIEYMNAGTEYRIGCSGNPGSYADCSGFIFQCLYSIGVNPTINIVDHALASKEYTSRDLCADDRLGLPVAISDMQPGDIIFYSSNGVQVTHVALYAGNGMMYDSNSGGVKMRNIWNTSTIVKIVRVCPD